MDWNAYMEEIGHEIAAFSKEVPETVNGFTQMGRHLCGSFGSPDLYMTVICVCSSVLVLRR